MIVCDGLPALLGLNLIFNTYFCQKPNEQSKNHN